MTEVGLCAACQRRRKRRYITAFGRTSTLSEWAAETSIHISVIAWRLDHRWAPEAAVSGGPSAGRPRSERLRLISVDGKTKPLSAWAEERGMSASTLRARLQLGWSEEDAVVRPVRARR